MPTYDYQCRSCGSVTEVIHSMLEEGPSVCERCGGGLRRVLYPTGIIFKGSGFYRTDSRNGNLKSATGGEPTAPSGDSPGRKAPPGESAGSGSASSDAGSAKKSETSKD